MFDQTVADLVGRRISSVVYWDLPPFDDEPSDWDYGTWHHVVMGIELETDRGPVSLRWTDTFWPYGIEAFFTPMPELLRDGCTKRDVTAAERLDIALGGPIRAASTHWERFNLENPWPGQEATFDVPLGIRLDFDSGSVWVIIGIPQPPDMSDVFTPGDELMVVFEPARVREIGFPEDFVA